MRKTFRSSAIQNIEGLFIDESWSGSAGYLAEMLIEGAQTWGVEDKSALAPYLVNMKAETQALADYEDTHMKNILCLVVV